MTVRNGTFPQRHILVPACAGSPAARSSLCLLGARGLNVHPCVSASLVRRPGSRSAAHIPRAKASIRVAWSSAIPARGEAGDAVAAGLDAAGGAAGEEAVHSGVDARHPPARLVQPAPP